MAEQKMTQEEVALLYDAKSSNIAKGFLVLMIPLIGLIGLLLNRKSKLPYGKHIIFATHYFAFVLIFAVLWTGLIYIIPFKKFTKWYFIIPISLAMLIYYIFGSKRFYNQSRNASIWKGILGYILIIFCIQLYRVSVNLISLHTI